MRSPGESVTGKCLTVIREHGLGTLCARAATRLRRSLFVTNSADWYCVILLERRSDVSGPHRAEIEFDATEEVLTWLSELRHEFRWVWVEAELEAARKWQHIFPLLRLEGERAGYMKVGFARTYVTDFQRCIAVPSRTALIYDTFVHPTLRARGLATWAIRRTLDFLSQRGVRLVWCHIPRWNGASIAAYRNCGFTREGYVRFARVVGCRLYTCSPEKLMRHAQEKWTSREGGRRIRD